MFHYRQHPILKQQQQSLQHHDINANGIPSPLFPHSFSPFSAIQHTSNQSMPIPPHLPIPPPTHPFSYNPLSMAAVAVAQHKSLQHANNISSDAASSSNPNTEASAHKSGKIKINYFTKINHFPVL